MEKKTPPHPTMFSKILIVLPKIFTVLHVNERHGYGLTFEVFSSTTGKFMVLGLGSCHGP